MLAGTNVGRGLFPDDEGGGDVLSQYHHLITTRLCQVRTSHENRATTRLAYLNSPAKKCLFRQSSGMGLALRKGELLRSRLSTDALQLSLLVGIPRISAVGPMCAVSLLRRERAHPTGPRLPGLQLHTLTPSPDNPGP